MKSVFFAVDNMLWFTSLCVLMELVFSECEIGKVGQYCNIGGWIFLTWGLRFYSSDINIKKNIKHLKLNK